MGVSARQPTFTPGDYVRVLCDDTTGERRTAHVAVRAVRRLDCGCDMVTTVRPRPRGRTPDPEEPASCASHHEMRVIVPRCADHGNDDVPAPVRVAPDAVPILAASLGDEVDTPDGPMWVKTSGWSAATGNRRDVLDAITTSEPDPSRYLALLGPREHALLVSRRGARIHAGSWCACDAVPVDRWVRYEKWDLTGRVGHGWACLDCGGIVQTG